MDISIYDNYSGAKRDFEISTSDDGFRTCDSLLAVICLEGKAVFQLGKTEYEVKRHTFLVIAPKAIFRIKESNSKFRMDVLRVGEPATNMELMMEEFTWCGSLFLETETSMDYLNGFFSGMPAESDGVIDFSNSVVMYRDTPGIEHMG